MRPRRRSDQPSTTTTTAPAQPDPAWLQVPLTDPAYQQVLAATGGDSQAKPLLTARLPSGRVVVLVATETGRPAALGRRRHAGAPTGRGHPPSAARRATSPRSPP